MTNSLLPLRPSLHQTHGFIRPKDFAFTKNKPISVALIDEVTSLLPIYPLAFVKAQENGFALASVQGLHNDENLFLNEQFKWISNYIPNIYKSYPFVLVENALCFNMQSELYKEVPDEAKGDVRFFDDEGNVTDLVQKTLDFLSATNQYRQLTINAVKAIVDADLLQPWNLSTVIENPEKPLMKGLYCIDEKKLASLNAEQLEKLNKTHALTIAYAQLFSMQRISVLKQLYEIKRKQEQDKKIEDIDFDAYFGEGSMDSLQFE